MLCEECHYSQQQVKRDNCRRSCTALDDLELFSRKHSTGKRETCPSIQHCMSNMQNRSISVRLSRLLWPAMVSLSSQCQAPHLLTQQIADKVLDLTFGWAQTVQP